MKADHLERENLSMEDDIIVGSRATPESILAHLSLLEKVWEQAIKFDRMPLALIATCALCGERTESFSLRRMDPPPRHRPGCVLFGWEPTQSDALAKQGE